MRTGRLDREIKEKTLEAWIRVRKKPEKGTTILVLQNNSGYRGAAFDGIQYNGAKKKWENYSTAGFRDTQWDAPEENAEPGDHLQIAITYAADGTITGYRNGKQHGKPFHGEAGNPFSELQTYLPEDAMAMLTTNQSLNLDEARIYAAALSAQQINQMLTMERTAQARLEALRAAVQLQQLRLAQTQVLAPDDGVISARSATVGAVVPAGQELFRLIRQGRLEWRAEVAASELALLQPGQTVTVVPAGGTAIAGKVRMLAPTVDAGTRNGLVYVDLPPQAGVARAGMFARGEFAIGQSAGMTLPQSAVVLRDGFAYVLRRAGPGRASMPAGCPRAACPGAG